MLNLFFTFLLLITNRDAAKV